MVDNILLCTGINNIKHYPIIGIISINIINFLVFFIIHTVQSKFFHSPPKDYSTHGNVPHPNLSIYGMPYRYVS